jgi:hypothetical protein
MTLKILRYFDLETCASIDPQYHAVERIPVTQEDYDIALYQLQGEIDCRAEEIAAERWRRNWRDRP